MTPAEARALGSLGGRALSGLVSGIEHVHQVIAGRAFEAIGPSSNPVRLVHDIAARSAYLAVRGASTVAGAVGGHTAAPLVADGQQAGRSPTGNLALAALNAAAGDRLGSDLTPLTIRMAVRAGGRDVDLTARQLASVFPAATSRLAVFVHGLAETDIFWLRQSDQSAPYGQRLQAELGYTPVYVRYNTGRHVSDSGRDLAVLLEDLVAAWPLPVQEIMLVGHSMGGLVIRSACHYGQDSAAAWPRHVRHVFYLGSPHLGAPLARAAGLAGWVLGRLPETRPLGKLVAGPDSVRDLRHGYLLDDDWAGCDQTPCLHDHRSDAPLLAGANHYAISATMTADPGSPVGAIFGDLIVQPGSAHGRRRRRQHIDFPVDLGRRFGGMHHFDLLNHPDVWAAMHELVSRPGSDHAPEPASARVG
jgi:hypothetical protein